MKMRLTLAAFCAVSLAVPVSAQVEKKQVEGIRNYSRVDATVGCGGQVDPAAMATLRKEGFVSVINLRMASEEGANVEAGRAAAASAGLKYIHLPFNVATPDPKVVDRFLATVSDKSNQPVFIHCGSAGRVAGMWMIKRVLQDKWTSERAMVEARAIGLNNAQLEAFVTDYIRNHQ